MGHLDIRLLGPFEIRRDGRVVRVPGRKVRALLAMLALNCGRTVSFDGLGRALWADDPPQRLRGSLQTYVGRLRRVLGDDAVTTEPAGYRLDVPVESVDVLRFHRLLDDGKPVQALALWRGDPFGSALSAWFDEHETPALVERYLTAWEQRTDADITDLQKLTTRYPLRETLWLRLLTALRDAGRQAEALERYGALRQHLTDELGTDPSPSLQTLHHNLLTTAPSGGGRARVGAGRSGVALTRFFGRDAELDRVGRLLNGSRLVTIAGPPGAGKTRLVREYAAQQDSSLVLVELAAADSVASGVAGALGLRPGEVLRPTSDLLLILDNCEHLASEAAAYVVQLLADCPGLRVLATSRVPLAAPGEHVYRLPPLPDRTATELFIDRARLVNADFPRDDSPTVRQICRQLDGLPLAVELAAAWIRVLSAHQVLDRLTPLLNERHGRQATMRAALDASYRLLQPPQQQLFGRLAVFAGGFDLDALEAVAGLDDDLLTTLAALVDHSLVLTESLPDGRLRFRLLEPVRQYAVAVFDNEDAVRDRHARHYLAVVRRGDARLRGPDRATALVDLQREEANLLAALAWAGSRPNDLALRLSTALGYYSEHRGQVNEARARIEQYLGHAPAEPKVRAAALARLGRLAWRQRDYPAARRAYHQSLTLRRQLGDQNGSARSLRDLALATASSGDTGRAVELCEQSIGMFTRSGDERGRGWALTVLGLTLFENGRWAEGETHYREALEVSLAGGGAAMNVNARLGIAFSAAVAGDVDAHRHQLDAVVDQIRAASGLIEDPDWLWASMSLAANEGRTRAALRLAGAATALSRRGGRMSGTMTTFCDATVERLRRQIGVRRAARLMAAGRELSQDDLIVEALAPPTVDDRPLSRRELEVADLAGQGLSNDEIARSLTISRRTVETHLEHLRQKLDLTSRYEVVAWALTRSG
ncbi:putative ATPase [Kribbella sp. VKM Ac-2569]|uniref:BTAD domain-containing putative transcriptional regulator n=1 Tax=Kribbella sp. VKM Ac-2569 TaxID=2512220 RepID=UPI0010DBDC7B|nr:BTAD domain-containing putative transcriptional regulator [Kribbella sp. VKM Ac-2569]RZT12011.1 putative ATPase [Kribbella sp. VKM Ac-2569]